MLKWVVLLQIRDHCRKYAYPDDRAGLQTCFITAGCIILSIAAYPLCTQLFWGTILYPPMITICAVLRGMVSSASYSKTSRPPCLLVGALFWGNLVCTQEVLGMTGGVPLCPGLLLECWQCCLWYVYQHEREGERDTHTHTHTERERGGDGKTSISL
jgi:hypothetical protein